MSKVVNGVHVYELAEWSRLPETMKLLAEIEKCEECDGSGEHECDCGDTHDCGFCNGTGNVDGITPQIIYQRELQAELKRLLAWREGLPKTIETAKKKK